MTKVELVYIPANQIVFHKYVDYISDMTVADVLAQSNIINDHPEVAELSVGVFAELVSRDTLVKPGDRVEVYRSLTLDPMEKRRRRASLRK